MPLVKFLSQLRDLNVQLWVENGRLRYQAPQGVMTAELLDGIKERRVELINFLQQAVVRSGIEPAPAQEYYPTSPAQKRLYILSQLDSAQTGYNISGGARIEGKLDPNRLATAFKNLVKRHEAYRTTFELIDGRLMQRIHPEAELPVDYQELAVGDGRDRPVQDRPIHDRPVHDRSVREIVKEFIRPFDLSRAPLLRIKLLKVGPENYILLYDMSHLISDMVSMGILVREFAKLYHGESLPELTIQSKDFAYWQNHAGLEIIQRQEKYWLENFASPIPQLDLPTDYPRTAALNFQGTAADFWLDEELTTKLKQLAAVRKTTLFMALLAGYNLLLSRLSGVSEVTIGTTVTGRQAPELENIIGMFVNTLPLKNHVSMNQTFSEFLEGVRQNTLGAFENQDYQSEMLLERLKIPMDLSRNPLFNTLFNPQTDFNLNHYQFEVQGLKFTPYELESQTNTFAFDLMILVNESGNRVQLNCIYRTDLFKGATIQYLINEFIRLLSEIAQNPDEALQDYRVFYPRDIQPPKHQVPILASYQEFPAALVNRSIIERFQDQVKQYPSRIAAQVGSNSLNYESLNKRANQLARLIQEKQKAQQPIALLFGCNPDTFTAIIGVLKAGQAYLPLDPTYPKERLAYMLSDSGASLIVSDHQNVTLAVELSQGVERMIQVIDLSELNSTIADHDLNLVIPPEQVAYIKYTSGSTGKPKGIPQTHRNVLAFIRRYTNELHINPDDKVALFSSYSHSAGAIDIFSMLLNGGALYPFELKSEGIMRKVADWLLTEGITIFHSVPMVYRYCVESLKEGEKFTQVRLVVLGGEPVLAKDAARMNRYFGKDCVLVNMFGATEVIIGTFGITGQGDEITGAQVPVGYPVEEVKIYLLNEAGQEVPVFGVGEIVYESEYLALDYLNLPEKSAKSYGSNPLTGKGRVFRSGDLGRMMPDGQIEFLGRKDFQVKIRGFRIELGEIEATLDNMPGIHKSIVAGFEKGEGEYYLAAYYTTIDGNEPDSRAHAKELRRMLGQKLPDYMIPSYFVWLAKLPLTPNGKIDRKALPAPELGGNDTGSGYEPPGNEIEAKLVEIWQEVLGVEKAGIHDNFFDLGGHSLNATRVIQKVHKEFNVELPLRELFNTPTIEELAQQIAKLETNLYSAIQPAQKKEYYPVSTAQKRIYLISQLDRDATSYNTPAAVIIEGELDIRRFEEVFKALVNRHEAFRTSFDITAGEPVQRVHPEVDFKIEYEIPVGNGHDRSLQEFIPGIIHEFIRPFHLNEAPLLRVKLLKLSPKRYLMLYDMSHIISDRTSIGILAQEFVKLYRGEILPELPIQYKDYATWQNHLAKTDILKNQEEYWLHILNSAGVQTPTLMMPMDFRRPDTRSFIGKTIESAIPVEMAEKLRILVKKQNITLNALAFTLYSLLINQYSGQREIFIGSLVEGRRHPDLENIIGVFMNFLPIRVTIEPDRTFAEFLSTIHLTLIGAYENQDLPFEQMIEKAAIQTSSSRNPIFDTMLVFHNEIGAVENTEVNGLQLSEYPLNRETATLDFKMDIYPGNEGALRLSLEYNRGLFLEETIHQFLRDFIRITEKALAGQEWKLSELELFTAEEQLELARKRNLNAPSESSLARSGVSLAVAATFTADPIGDYLTWLCQEFNQTVQVQFASYNQVFQELLDPGSLISSNTGVNLLLVRFEDWIRDGRTAGREIYQKLEKNYADLIEILRNKLNIGPFFVGIFPVSTHLSLDDETQKYLEVLYERLETDLSGIEKVELLDFRWLADTYDIKDIFDAVKDKTGHLPFTEEFYAAMADAAAAKICLVLNPSLKVSAPRPAKEILKLPVHVQLPKKVLRKPYTPPTNSVEEKLIQIWEVILGVKKIGIGDNFFELGGDSLKAANMVSKIYQEFHIDVALREVFDLKTLQQLAQHIAGTAKQSIYETIEPAGKRDYYPLSSAQKRMYHISRLEGVGTSYNMPGVSLLEGPLDRQRLNETLKELVRRHEALRTSFLIIEGEPLQKIDESLDFKLEYREAETEQAPNIIREFIRPFDLNSPPLFRVGLIRITETKHILILDLHHIIADGVSLQILTQEFKSLYQGGQFPPLRIHYKDYAVWQNQLMFGERHTGAWQNQLMFGERHTGVRQNELSNTGYLQSQEDYWLNIFSKPAPGLMLRTDYPRPALQSFAGDLIRFEIRPDLAGRLNQLALENEATLFMVLLAAYYVLLYKHTEQNDIVIGLPVAGRPHPDLEKIIGMFANTLALRNYPLGSKPFSEFLAEVKTNLLKAYENQDYQFEELVAKLQVPRDPSRNPLFDVGFGMQPMIIPDEDFDNLRIRPYEMEHTATKLDFIMHISQGNRELGFELEYCIKLFTKETVTRLGRRYLNILERITENSDPKLVEIDILTDSEKTEILTGFNQSAGADDYDF